MHPVDGHRDFSGAGMRVAFAPHDTPRHEGRQHASLHWSAVVPSVKHMVLFGAGPSGLVHVRLREPQVVGVGSQQNGACVVVAYSEKH